MPRSGILFAWTCSAWACDKACDSADVAPPLLLPFMEDVPETPDIAEPMDALEEASEAIELSILPLPVPPVDGPRSPLPAPFEEGEAALLLLLPPPMPPNGVEGRDNPAVDADAEP